MSTGRLGVLTSNFESPVVSQTSVHSDLLHSLDVVSELGVHFVGSDLLELAILEVSSLVEEPLRESVGLWVSNDLSDLGDLSLGQFTGTALKSLTACGYRFWPSCRG